MASYQKRGDGYSVRWRDLDGLPHSRQVPDATTARRLRRDIERTHGEGRDWRPAPTRRGPDLRAIADAWIRECARLRAPRTVVRYGEMMDAFLDWLQVQEGARTRLGPELLTRPTLADYHGHLVTTGRHGHARTQTTARKHLEAVALFWRWAYDHDEDQGWADLVPRPRPLEMPRRERAVAVAPTWAEMDAALLQLSGWAYRLACIQRSTGARIGEALALRWEGVDLDGQAFTFRPETTKGGYGGRVVPIPTHLSDELAGWGRRVGLVVGAPERETTGRGHAGRTLTRAWVRAGVRREAWEGHPTHAFRRGYVSGLLSLGASRDAVEVLVGHSLGAVRGAYVDPAALRLRETVGLVPAPATSLDCARLVRETGGSEK